MHFANNYFTALLFCLFVLVRFHIGGAAITTVEVDLLPRAIGTVFSLTGLWVRNKPKNAYIFFLLSFIFHPLSGLFGIILYGVWLSNKKLSNLNFVFRNTLYLTLVLFVVLVSAWNLPQISNSWLSIIRLRNSYAFADLWSSRAWINLLILLLPGLIYLLILNNEKIRKTFISLVVLSVVVSLTNVFFVVVHPTKLVIQLQLLRIWFYPALVSIFCAAILLDKFTIKFKWLRVIIVFLLIGLIYSRNSANSAGSANWKEMTVWVKSNTLHNCVFLTPFYNKGFRLLSERSIIGEYKDGALSFYSEEFANQWFTRLLDLNDIQSKTDEMISKLQKKYEFNYLVEKENPQRKFSQVYKNSEFVIYQLSACEKL